MLVYLLKSTACLAILFAFYKVFLEKESIHKFKRFYLLGALLFSLIVPGLVFTEYVESAPLNQNTYTSEEAIQPPVDIINVPQALATDVLDIEPLLWGIYFIGLFFFSIKFIRNLFQIFFRIRKNPKNKLAEITQVLLREKITPHTFMSYIFLNKAKFENNQIPKEVLLHEETHAKQKHSWDVIFVELLQVIFWINPLIYISKKAIKLNHEFLADQAVLEKNIDQTIYKNTLLSYLSSNSEKRYQPLSNAINYSSIKKRFTVMKKRTSKKSVVLRSFLLLPLVALLLFGFTKTIQVEKKNPVDQFLSMEILGDNNIKVQNGIFHFNEIPKILKDNYPENFNTNDLSVKISTNQPVHLNSINELFKEIRKTGITQIEVTADEILMDEGQYQDNISITKETAILNANRMTIIGHISRENATQSNTLKFNALAKKYNAIPIEKRIIPLKDLRILETIYGKMTDDQKQNAQPFPKCLPTNTTQKTVSLIEININNKGQLLVQSNLVKLKDLKAFLSKINNHLSFEQRKKVVQSVIQVDNKTPKDVIKKVDKILTEYGTATINIVGLENPTQSHKQQSATREEMAAYNGLAKKYNEMDRNHMYIKKQEVDILKNIYGKMTKKQKADAEPFPDFPEPPSTPDAPKPPKNVPDTDYAANQIENIIEQQEPYDVIGQSLTLTQPKQPIAPKSVQNVQNTRPPQPPLPPKPKTPLDFVIEMAKKRALFTYEGQEISSDKAINLFKKNKNLNIESKSINGRQTVKITKDPVTTN